VRLIAHPPEPLGGKNPPGDGGIRLAQFLASRFCLIRAG